jgi:zinc D-Ala-D-Ala dipeptidase
METKLLKLLTSILMLYLLLVGAGCSTVKISKKVGNKIPTNTPSKLEGISQEKRHELEESALKNPETWECPKGMVDIKEKLKDVSIELMYTEPENISGRALYPKTMRAYATKALVKKLSKAVKELKKKNCRLVILDAYRPKEVTSIFWDKAVELHLTSYYAPPKFGSPHNRGMAVDVTLENKDGKRLDMPSKPDQPISTAITKQQRENFNILKNAMLNAGFKNLSNEWWHYEIN